jgi:hypothetical protein
MSLIRVLTPDSEVELLIICSMLEARGVPFFVRNAGLGSLFPGATPESAIARAIMVPEERAEEASALIADFRGSTEPKP